MTETKTKHIQDLIRPGSWAGKRSFIVAGGPSLRDFDFSLLEGENTIGINRAFELFNPTINYSMDPDFFGWIERGELGEEATKRWNAYKGIKAFLDMGNFPYPPDITRVKNRPATAGNAPTLDLEAGIYAGPNSAYAGIVLAAALGSTEIYVLGLDMKGIDGKQANWHAGYPKMKESSVYDRAVPKYNELGAFLENSGVKVFNLSPRSSITCWPKMHWSSVFKTIHIRTYLGFGDNMYSAPFIKRMARDYERAYIETPWPQLYQEIPNASFMHTGVTLHAQAAADLAWSFWAPVKPSAFTRFQNFYESTRKSEVESVPERFAKETGWWDIDMSLDIQHSWIDQAKDILLKNGIDKFSLASKFKGLCVVKQQTFRKEWYVETRNPKQGYIQHLVDRARQAGYFTVSVADLREGQEWADGPELDVDLRLHHKEIDIFGTVGLVWLSDMVIGYPSFFIPLSLSLQKKTIIVYGGCGRPSLFKSEKLYNLSNYRDVAPDPFCHCMCMKHPEGAKTPRCNKDIPLSKLDAAFDSLVAKR